MKKVKKIRNMQRRREPAASVSQHAPAEFISEGNQTRYFIHGPNGLLSQQEPDGSWRTPIQDGLNSIRDLTDETRAILESRHYDAFGNLIGLQGTIQTPFGFTGELTDPNGLVHLRARDYNPQLGRFLSLDQLESNNRYLYADNDPVNHVDPSGKSTQGPPNHSCPPGYNPAPLSACCGRNMSPGDCGAYIQVLKNEGNACCEKDGSYFEAKGAWLDYNHYTKVAIPDDHAANDALKAIFGIGALIAAPVAGGIALGSTAFIVGALAWEAGYLAYSLWEERNGQSASSCDSVLGILTGYDFIQRDIQTLQSPEASKTRKAIAFADATFNTVMGLVTAEGLVASARSLKLTADLYRAGSAEMREQILRNAAREVELELGDQFYRHVSATGVHTVEIPTAALSEHGLLSAMKLAGGFSHEMAHVRQGYGFLHQASIASERWMSSGNVKGISVGILSYILNPAEVNAFASGLFFWKNAAFLTLNKVIQVAIDAGFVHPGIGDQIRQELGVY